MKRTQLLAFEGLRFLAFFQIFLWHSKKLISWGSWQPDGTSANWAVSFFIMMSGFLIGWNDNGQPVSLRSVCRYMLGKARRFYPLVLLTMLLSTQLLIEERGHLSWGLLVNLTLLEAWFPKLCYGYNGVCWFLSMMMFLYLISRPMLVFLRGRSCRFLWLVLIGSFLVSGCWTWVCCRWGGENAEYLTYIFPPARLFEFLAAMVLGKLVATTPCVKRVSLWTAVEILTIALWLMVPSFAACLGLCWFYGMLWWGAINLLMLYVLCAGCGLVRRLLSCKPFVLLGALSMPCYLLHSPILDWSRQIVAWDHLASGLWSVRTMLWLGCLGATLLLAWMTNKIRKKGFAMRPMAFCITFDDGLLAQARVAAPILEKFGWHGIFTIPTEIISSRKLSPEQVKDLCLEGNEDKLMTWDDVRTLVAHGHEVCPHTCSHADLPTLFRAGKLQEIEMEITRSRDQLAAQTGNMPRFFCLPHSQHNPVIDAMIRRAGMEPINGGGCWRPNVGEGAANGESFRDITGFLRKCYANGEPQVDIVVHGIVRTEGGWHPFEDAADFERFCREIQAEVDTGRVKVVDYGDAHIALPHFRALRRAVYWCHRKERQLRFKRARR